MRARFLILPVLLSVVACSQPNEALRVWNGLTPRKETVSDKKFESLVTFDKCLNVPGLLKYIQDNGQSVVTVYVRDMEIDKGSDLNAEKIPVLDDAKLEREQLFSSPSPLVEALPPNRIYNADILQSYLINDQSGCSSSVVVDGTRYSIQNALDATTIKQLTRRMGVLNNQQNQNQNGNLLSTTKTVPSKTLYSLDLISDDGDKRLVYKEAGNILTITIRTKNPPLATCTDKNVATVTTKQIVVQHGDSTNKFSLKTEFYQILTKVLDPKVLTQDITNLVKTSQAQGKAVNTRATVPVSSPRFVTLEYSQLASLSNAIGAGLFVENKCK